MTFIYHALNVALVMMLFFVSTLSFAQEPPTNKSVKIENIENQNNRIEPSITRTESDNKLQNKVQENNRDWLDKFLADPIHLLTFLLFIATCALYWATRQLVIGAEKNAQTQLRAYVSMMHSEKISFSDDGSLIVSVITKNHGNTPAFNLTCSLNINLHKWPLEIKLDSPNFPEHASKSTLSPGESIHSCVELGKKLNQQQIEAINQENGAIVVWGEVHYTDVFEKPRKTSLCLYSTGDDFNQREFAYHSHGNDSN
ncbi:hypothetical protein R2083_11425 [Nitrosomonas sp. Is35]|uniref:hypothetical protein n=1 Tax=Nitrosomonas sp. Is35 TaxID=3080534 RepID=UPI00294B5921|nr:hypothetical protein [Nitrosomonas sp. Is35]MDV6348124.1 hypothetical protein [Nitrosomonas sp. Is35]